jgi:hypothetical protein
MTIEKFLNIRESQTVQNLLSLGYKTYKHDAEPMYFDLIKLQKPVTNAEGLELFWITATFRSYVRNKNLKNFDTASRFLDFEVQIHPMINGVKETLQVSTVQQFNRFFEMLYDDVEISTGEIKKVEDYFAHLFDQIYCAAYEDDTVFGISDEYYVKSLDKEPSNIAKLNFSTILNNCKAKGLPIEKIAQLFEGGDFELIAQLLFN